MRMTPLRVAGGVAGIVAVVAIALYLIPSNDYLFLPDPAHPVAQLMRVQGGHDPTGPGGIYFVDVFERRASMLESLFPSIRDGSTLVPASAIVTPGVSDAAQRRADLRQMSISQRVAAAVAERRLGYHVVAKPSGVIVDAIEIGSHAVGKLQPTDVIVAVNGKPTLTIAALRAQLALVAPGGSVTLSVRRGGGALVLTVKTIADPNAPRRAIIGFQPAQSADIHLPLRVEIASGDIGGPSAGLAFALEVMQKLGRNVAHGYRVVATGTISLDGSVGAIGGIEQKTIGAREAKADVFLVPVAGDNAVDARRYAHGLRIIAVQSFPQALHALATLPPKG